MSREIKFNAVDETDGDYIRFDDFIAELKKPNNFDYVEFDDSATDNELLAKFLEFYFGYKLLQYTGLKDKNGVEIVEGDVIKMFDIEITDDDYTQFVIFHNGAFGYMTGGKYSYFVSIAGNTNICFNGDKCMDCEVIGNIYENKELLNESS